MPTITADGTTITPILVVGHESIRETGTIIHRVLNSETIQVTLRPARLRSGTFYALMASEPAARACATFHAGTRVLTLTDAEVPGLSMRYVVAPGEITSTLDTDTQRRWIVAIPYQEIP